MESNFAPGWIIPRISPRPNLDDEILDFELVLKGVQTFEVDGVVLMYFVCGMDRDL